MCKSLKKLPPYKEFPKIIPKREKTENPENSRSEEMTFNPLFF
jgi:hypothetical protein